MKNNFRKILNELSYRVSSGIPDLTNEQHLMKLWDILKEHDWNIDARVELLKNLTEQTGKKLSQKEVLNLLIKEPDLQKGSESMTKKVYGDIENSKLESYIKKHFKGATNIKSYSPKTGPNESGRDTLFTWTWEGNDYKIHLATTKITGRGSKQTKDQELSWLLFLSGMQCGADPNNKDEFISTLISNPQVYGKVEGVNEQEAFNLAAYLENNDDWYKSHQGQCTKFIQLVSNKQPKRYLKDDSGLNVNSVAKKLYQDEYGRKLDLDKWNPADVWLEYNSSIPSFKTLTEFNNWLVDSLHKGSGIIGVSLKKGGGKVGLVNDYERKEYILSSLKLKYGALLSQGVTFDYQGKNLDGLGLNFRIFQGKSNEVIRGEGTAKGAEAVQGKVALKVIDDFKKGIFSTVSNMRGQSVQKDKKTKKYVFTPKGKSNFKLVQKYFPKIKNATFLNTTGDWKKSLSSEKSFLDNLNTHPKIVKMREGSVQANLNARFQTIVLGSMISNLSKKDQQDVMVGMLKYGKSESDWSSAHYKAQ